MKDKSFLNNKNLETIRNDKKPISEKSWDRINKHFEDKKPKGKIFFLNNYMKIAAGLILLLSFSWMIYNNAVSVPEFNTVVSDEPTNLNIGLPNIENNTSNISPKNRVEADRSLVAEEDFSKISKENTKEVARIENYEKQGKQGKQGPQKAPLVSKSNESNIGIEINEENFIAITLDSESQKSTLLNSERPIKDIAAIQTQIPLVYSESFQSLNMKDHLTQTEISNAYYDGVSTGAMVGQSLLTIISDNTVVSDLNNKFQKFKKLEVIQINW